MKINPINYNKSINFGYNKKANEKLKRQLSEHPDKDWAETLLTLNDYCNGIEDKIRREERKKDKSIIYDYLDIFASSKNMLAGYVMTTFDSSEFADAEYRHYKAEIAKRGYKQDDWRKEVCESLENWLSNPSSIKDEYEKRYPSIAKKPSLSAQQEVVDSSDSEPANESPLQNISNVIPENQKSLLEITANNPNTPKGFCDIAGMDKLKRDFEEGIIQYIKDPEQSQRDFEEYGKTLSKAVLLYGPPGCGKTYITEALSQEVQVPLYKLKISKAGSHYINMTSKNIAGAFEQATEFTKRSGKPCILFLDEIDSLAFDRTSRTENEDLKQVTTLLQEMDKAKNTDIVLIGATNKYGLLDPAIRRRFTSKIGVDIPDTEAIADLVVKKLTPMTKGKTLRESDEDINKIAKSLYGYSNSSICEITKQAALNALRRDRAEIALQDFEKAIAETTEEKPDRKAYFPDDQKKTKLGF